MILASIKQVVQGCRKPTVFIDCDWRETADIAILLLALTTVWGGDHGNHQEASLDRVIWPNTILASLHSNCYCLHSAQRSQMVKVMINSYITAMMSSLLADE